MQFQEERFSIFSIISRTRCETRHPLGNMELMRRQAFPSESLKSVMLCY